MAKHFKRRLLASELEILETIWGTNGLTIVEVLRKVAGESGYTTIQTRLNRMVAKGYLKRTNTRPSRYIGAVDRETVASNDLETLVKRVNQGRVVPLVAMLVRQSQLSQSEIDELRQLIDRAEDSIRKKT